MEKLKDFIKNKKKIWIPVLILIILLLAIGIYFAVSRGVQIEKTLCRKQKKM